jgi:hypothetical protein
MLNERTRYELLAVALAPVTLVCVVLYFMLWGGRNAWDWGAKKMGVRNQKFAWVYRAWRIFWNRE